MKGSKRFTKQYENKRKALGKSNYYLGENLSVVINRNCNKVSYAFEQQKKFKTY